MVLPGHLAGGYLATTALLSLAHGNFSSSQITALTLIGMLASEGPDSDLIWFYVVHKFKLGNDQSHRDYLTHAPINWLILCLVISIIGLLINSRFVEFLGATIFVGSWSHFILDSIEYGIMWLWPFSKRRYALIHVQEETVTNEKAGTFGYYWAFIRNVYVKRVTFYCEILIVLIALYVYLH